MFSEGGLDFVLGKSIARTNKIISIRVGLIGIDVINELQNRKRIFMNTPFGSPSEVILEGEIDDVPCVLLPHINRLNVLSSYSNAHANIWALNNLGVTHIIAVYPGSSLRETMYPGDVIAPDNIINHTAWRNQTDNTGVESFRCHMPMSPPFNENLRNSIMNAGKSIDIPVMNGGTVLAIQGPRWPTIAECTLYRSWQADLVTTTQLVPDGTLSAHAGILFAPIVVVTNYAKWGDINGNKILDVYDTYLPNVIRVVLQSINNISNLNWSNEIVTHRNRASINVTSNFEIIIEENALPHRLVRGDKIKAIEAFQSIQK